MSNTPNHQPPFNEQEAKRIQRGVDHLSGAQGVVNRMLSDPVLGKMFVKPNFPLPPMPWEVERISEAEGEQ